MTTIRSTTHYSNFIAEHGTKVGPLFVIIAAILWALDGIIRRSLFSLPSVTIVFYEHLIGSLILVPLAFSHLKSELATIKTKEVLTLAVIIAFFSGLLGTVWFTSALAAVGFLPFSVVFLLQKLQPLFTISAAAVLLKEKINWQFGVWALLAIVAAYFVTFPGGVVNLATGEGTTKAALFAVGAAAAWGTSTVFSKMLLKKVSNTTATALRFSLTSVFALIAVFVTGVGATLVAPDLSQWGRFVAIALSTGMVAVWIYYQGLQHTKAQITTLLELVFPFLAVLIDAVVYKTWLQPSQYMASVVLLGAMLMVAKLNSTQQS